MMPIGVPRVPYRTPKEGTWQWVDIWNCLYRERIIFLSKPVDEELGNQVGLAKEGAPLICSGCGCFALMLVCCFAGTQTSPAAWLSARHARRMSSWPVRQLWALCCP